MRGEDSGKFSKKNYINGLGKRKLTPSVSLHRVSLKKRAKLVVAGLNAIDGFSCQPAEGAMYCFPRIDIPPAAQAAAKEQGTTPDGMYALSLLRRTGICVVPASGFGQKPGRFGFRTTFLPPEEEMEEAVNLFKTHHEEFVEKYK